MTSKFKIEDMHCNHCVAAIKDAVSALDGINSVEVVLDSKTCTVDFNESKLSDNDICGAIDEIGFEAAKI